MAIEGTDKDRSEPTRVTVGADMEGDDDVTVLPQVNLRYVSDTVEVVPEGRPAGPTGGYDMYTMTFAPVVPAGTAMERPVKFATPPTIGAVTDPSVAAVAEFAPTTDIFIPFTVVAVGETSLNVA